MTRCVGIIGNTLECVRRVRDELGISPQESVLISRRNHVLGCHLTAAVWASEDIPTELLQAVEPALVHANVQVVAR